MITILIDPAETRRNPIALGKAGETGAVQVIFDLEDLIDLYGEGIPVLLFLRPGEAVPYEPEITVDDSSVYWTITDTETVEGTGTAEFQWYTDSTVVKSNTYTTVCLPSLASVLKDSTAEELWLNSMAALAAEVKINTTAAAASQEAASGYADAAADSADAASEGALAAANSETAAAESAEAAAASESSAAESASAAAESASAAATSESNAAASAESAASSAEAAAESASAAADSASAASESETSAASSASAAAESASAAEAAQSAAETAQAAAEAAQEGLETAQAAAEASAESAAESASSAAEAAAEVISILEGESSFVLTADEDGSCWLTWYGDE